MTTGELTCHELVQLVTEYLEGAMPRSDRERLEVHLAICVHCQRYLDQMRRTIQTVGALREEAIAPEAQRNLLGVFQAWKQGTPD